MQNLTLYELSDRLRAALDSIEIDEETGEVLNFESIEEAQAEFGEKVENIALYIKNTAALSVAIKSEQDALNKRRKTLENKEARLSEYLLSQMQSVGQSKFETERVKIAIRPSESVKIIDETQLPAEYIREKTTIEPNKAEIKKAIKNGETVTGATLEQKYNVNIK